LPALEHHTYSADDVEEGGIKIKKKNKGQFFFHENDNFFRAEVGKILFLFQITTFGCRRVRLTTYKKIFAIPSLHNMQIKNGVEN
jgi:hypothetical protein